MDGMLAPISNATPPAVSVLMPTYNVEAYVEEAVRSILDQTLSDLELVIQDDGSTDGTFDVLTALSCEDRRIVLLQPFRGNRGVTAARNSLMAHARGTFIAWMDADDHSDRSRLARQMAFLRENPAIGAVGTAIRYADHNMRPFRTEVFSRDPRRQAVDPQICCATVMARREVALKARFREAFRPGGEDGDWLLQLADHADVTNIDDVLYTYRQHNSTSNRTAGAIRRLGVLARHSAKMRRSAQPDPADALVPDHALGYLADRVFLDDDELTADQKLTALSFPLPRHPRLISVIVHYRGGGDFLRQCLQHLARQTFRNFEVLIADEGCEAPVQLEDFADILRDIPARVERSPEPDCVVVAASHLLQLAKGAFIAWQDADDYSRENRLEVQLRYLLSRPDCNAVGTALNHLRNGTIARSQHYHERAFRGRQLSGEFATFMARRTALDTIDLHGWPQRTSPTQHASEDGGLLSCIEPRTSVHNIGDILYFRREQQPQHSTPPHPAESEASSLLTRHLEERGMAPLFDGEVSAEQVRDQISAFLDLRRARLDDTPLGRALLRLTLRDVKEGRRSPLAILPLVLRFPRGMLRETCAFVGSRMRGVPRAGSTQPSVACADAEASPASRPFGRPAVLRQRPADIVARCWDCWGDLDDALSYLTPAGTGIWDNVAFVRETAFAPDWHVVFNTPGAHAIDIAASPNRVIFAIGEPPTRAHRPLHEGQGEGTIVLTSDEDLVRLADSPRRYILAPTMTRAWSVRKTYDELRATSVVDKPRTLSWITSNLNLLPGHRYRLDFLERLQKHVAFDLFGRGYRPIGNKWIGLAPYRYSIAFENTRASFYFTEKLMDCFVAETMPLYFGSPDITRFFPAEAMVLIDPEDPDVFRKIKDVIASDRWKTNRDAILEAKRLVLEKYNTFAYLASLMTSTIDPPAPPRPMHIAPVAVNFGAAP
jgi:glycosyltransferase involved in cell wall biosynthesis